MTYYQRYLQLPVLLKRKSHFLFGPRATGKSTLIVQQLPHTAYINLLDSATYFKLLNHPDQLENLIEPQQAAQKGVVIDEIQLIPQLLNEVHRLIESKHWHFLLTGSSGRKLKRGQANLLAGRARQAQLHPLTYHEIPDFDLQHYLNFGGLPAIYTSDDPFDDLMAYTNTYLKEEIQAEAAVRKLASFSKFLELSAFMNGQQLNFSELANDTGITATTIREYYYLLEDTFMGFFLPCYQKTQKRKAVSRAKFYYFDIGIAHALRNLRYVAHQSDDFGRAFKHFIGMEIRAYLNYRRTHLPLTYWQTRTGIEVDFLAGDQLAVEVKTTTNVQNKHLKGLKALAEEHLFNQLILVSQDPVIQYMDSITIMPWQTFLDKLWNDELISV